MTPAISFVVPACNAAGTIAETLASVGEQSVPCETIVVDDGSTDATPSIAGEFDARVISQDNTGLAGARNEGFACATANIVCFLDADDVVRPDFAQRMVDGLGCHDLCACAHLMAGPELDDLGWVSSPGVHEMTVDRMLGVNPFVVGAVVMRRDAPERLGLDEVFDRTMPVHEDWDLWLRLTGAGASWAPVVTAPLFVYRLRSGSMSCDLDLMWRVGLRVIGRSGAGLPEQNEARRQWTIRSLARAIARGDRALATGWAQFLDEIADADVGLLAASLRWALQREDIVGPADVGKRARDWTSRVQSTLEADLATRVLRRLDLSPRDWAAMAQTALSRRAPGERIVLYGLGRNGRSLLTALGACSDFAGASFIDDDPGVRATGAMRISVESLSPSDVVIVTPDDHAAIVERLQAHDRVLTLSDLTPRRASA